MATLRAEIWSRVLPNTKQEKLLTSCYNILFVLQCIVNDISSQN
jgi:hypothetical protein